MPQKTSLSVDELFSLPFANHIDLIVEKHGGTTHALDMRSSVLTDSKRALSRDQYVEHLVRKNGQLRTELAFYKRHYKIAQSFMRSMQRQYLRFDKRLILEQRILELLHAPVHLDIQTIAMKMKRAMEKYKDGYQRAYKEYVLPFEGQGVAIR